MMKKRTNVVIAPAANAGSVRSYSAEPTPAASPPHTGPNSRPESTHRILPILSIV